jgi:hypothetical protein
VRGSKPGLSRHADAESRFNLQVRRDAGTDCWLWLGRTDADGYGTFHVLGVVVRAHRYAFQSRKGAIPEGYYVCHSCDNPTCVNPDHLFVGTAADNAKDCVSKGRHLTWHKRSATKLTPDLVRFIRSSPLTRRELAKETGVSVSMVRLVQRRLKWKSVDGGVNA